MATDNLEGDDSRVIMDRVIPFIENAVKEKKPFLAVIWFHTPHPPVVAGRKYRAIYQDQPESAQHYFGCLTAMDEQMGRLRRELKKLGVEENTIIWFCSDNGPGSYHHKVGSAGAFRGRKGSLFEGGVRVPGLLVWPAKIKQSRVTKMPCSTLDYYPTILDIVGFKMKDQPEPIDGISLLPLINGKMQSRPKPIVFAQGKQLALTDNRYKIISTDRGKTYSLYDLVDDPGEKKDLKAGKPRIFRKMKDTLKNWQNSCRESRAGKGYKEGSY